MKIASELPPVASVAERLQTLLQQASRARPQNVTSQPLPVDALLEDLDTLHDEIPPQYDQGYKFSVVETAARELFYAWVGHLNLEDTEFANVWNLLDILLYAGDRDLCAPDLVCLLIEELMDSLTTTGCRTVMDYLESRRETLAKKDFHKKNLVLLRACNELLRRLSRAEDAIFCGRVFFFLFLAFPLGDRSSVNLRGEFHTENTTKFEVSESAPQSQQDGDKMDVDDKQAKSEPEISKPSTPQPGGKPAAKSTATKHPSKKVAEEAVVLSNSELYPIFWRLQQDFSDPTRLFAPTELQRFKAGISSTIVKFKATSVVQTKATEDGKRGTKRKLGADSNGERGDEVAESRNNYMPKYLTSRELFDLELSDLAFQRHILVQALILIDFLLSVTEKAKKKADMLNASNKVLSFKEFILSEKDAAWAIETRSTIYASLSAPREDGTLFQRMVKTVLARDKNWVRWKLDGCPSIVREPVSTESELEAREGAKKYTAPRKVQEHPEGAMSLAFLDDVSDGGLEALKDPSRHAVASTDDLINGIQTDELDLEMATDTEREGLENAMANKTWRLLRQTRSSRLGLLDKIEPGGNLAAVFQHPPETEPPDAAVEAAIEAPSAEPDVNGGPDVVVTAEVQGGAGEAMQVTDETTTTADKPADEAAAVA